MSRLSPARSVAFQVLLRVETRASYAADLLNSPLAERLSPADRALAQELAMGCLRWQGQLDFLIRHFSGQDPARLDAEVRLALRLGMYQLRFLERVPARAAVDQGVELVKRARKSSAAGLVNAVLRKVTRGPVPMPETALYSHPEWLLARWGKEIAGLNNQRPVTFVRLPPGAAHGVLQPGRYVRRCAVAEGPTPFPIQDETSQMIPYLLDVRNGQWVLDLCSAPGMKTAGMAELAPGAKLVACDLHPARLAMVPGRLRVALDGTQPLPLARRFDRVLLDAPCSGTGTVRRNPEIKWRLKPEDLPALAAKQRALLENALESLEPGGRLVYSTCSLEPEENEQVVEAVLGRRAGFVLRSAAAERDRLRESFTEEGLAMLGNPYFRALPSDHGADGFFAAIIERQGPPVGVLE